MQEQIHTLKERYYIVEDKLQNGLTLTQTCLKYKILHRSSLRNWIRQYKYGRLEPMSDKKKDKKREAKPADTSASRIRELERELLYARAENAYLKKLQALMQATKSRSID